MDRAADCEKDVPLCTARGRPTGDGCGPEGEAARAVLKVWGGGGAGDRRSSGRVLEGVTCVNCHTGKTPSNHAVLPTRPLPLCALPHEDVAAAPHRQRRVGQRGVRIVDAPVGGLGFHQA